MTANEGQWRPTQVNEGQRRPTQVNEGQRRQKGPKRHVWRRLGPRCVSFSCFLFYSYYYETRKPTAANAGQRRPTKANDGQRRPTQVNKGPQQPMAANKGQQRQKGHKRRVWRRFGPRCVSFSFFLILFLLLWDTKAHSSQRRPTKANDGQRRPTQVHEGPHYFLFLLCFIVTNLNVDSISLRFPLHEPPPTPVLEIDSQIDLELRSQLWMKSCMY